MLKKQARFLRYRLLPLVLSPIILGSQILGLNAQTAPPDPQRFQAEIKRFVQWDQKNSPPKHAILFVGSSSITLWDTATAFPGLTVINRGFGGSQIPDITYYYDQVVKPYQPAKIVFYAGENDIASGQTIEQLLQNFKVFLEKVDRDFPGTPVFYLAIKPSLLRWTMWPELDKANTEIRQFIATKPNLYYVDTASVLLSGTTKPSATLFKEDGLHLSESGYQRWQKVLFPYLEKE